MRAEGGGGRHSTKVPFSFRSSSKWKVTRYNTLTLLQRFTVYPALACTSSPLENRIIAQALELNQSPTTYLSVTLQRQFSNLRLRFPICMEILIILSSGCRYGDHMRCPSIHPFIHQTVLSKSYMPSSVLSTGNKLCQKLSLREKFSLVGGTEHRH